MPEECDGYLFRCHSESLCLLLLQLQYSLNFGCSLLLYKDQLWISKHLPVARVFLPGAHRCMAVKYIARLSLFTYRCQGRYSLSSSYATYANALRPPDKLPLTTRLFHHRLAVGCAEFDCCSPCCQFVCFLRRVAFRGLRGSWLRTPFRARHWVVSGANTGWASVVLCWTTRRLASGLHEHMDKATCGEYSGCRGD